MWLKENKDNLRTIILKILVAKRNKLDWNEVKYSRSRHNAKQTSFTVSFLSSLKPREGGELPYETDRDARRLA